MYGGNPYIASSKGVTPCMATTDIYLKNYIKNAEKAYTILKFVFGTEKYKEIILGIRNALLSTTSNEDRYMYFIYNKCDTKNLGSSKKIMSI